MTQQNCKANCYIAHFGLRVLCDIVCHYTLGIRAIKCLLVCYSELPFQWKCTDRCEDEYNDCKKTFGCRPYNT